MTKKPAHSKEIIADYKDELGNEEVLIYEKKKNVDHPLARIWRVFASLYLQTKLNRI